MARYLVTSALPYINGIKHLGNLVGSMLPSDVYARYQRLRGHEVLHICATDEHGTPAELAARGDGMPIDDYCAHMHTVQKDLGDRFRLGFDWFGRSSHSHNHQLTQHFAGRLWENGLIEEADTSQIYSTTDGRFLPDRYITGTCPSCGYDRARGDQCENCTKQLDPADLVDPRSTISGATDLELRESRHLFLRQSQMRDRLRDWIESKDEWPKISQSIALKWLNEGLEDRGITRDLSWGVPVRRGDDPWPGMEDKVFYVWFDAPIAYIGATAEWADATGGDWRRWWREDQGADDVHYIQFMAKDNIPFHTLSFPATLMGSGEPWKLVDYVKGFNWLTYDTGKFSTTQRRGVFMHDALEILPSDCWRWWLLANAPESSDSDFTWESLQSCVNKDLADVLGNFLHRAAAFCHRRLDGRVPQGDVAGETETALEREAEAALREYEASMDAVELRRSAAALRRLWTLGNEFLQRAEPWSHFKSDRTRAETALRAALSYARCLATLCHPFIPDAAERMLELFGEGPPQSGSWPAHIDLSALAPGHPLTDPQPLFAKIEDSEVAAWKNRFSGEKDEIP